MTRYFIFTACFFLLFSLGSLNAKVNDQSAAAITSIDNPETGNASNGMADNQGKALPVPQGTKSHLPAEKSHSNTPTMDETAHIHRFHKERVRKIKKHHSKFWVLSKLILIVCHISILVIAYLHATH
ncbi:MAG TPA: hypothetical protein VF487_06675 [Chitinophagaceae bacterium]